MEFTEQSIHKQSKADLFAHYKRKEIKEVQDRITENISITDKRKMISDSIKVVNCLKNHFIFYNLSENQLENIKDRMFYCDVDEDSYIYTEEQFGNCFFVVDYGLVELVSDDKLKKQYKPGEGFGELALLYHTKRKNSIRSKTDSGFWVIDRQTFRNAVEQVIVREYNENRKCLESIKFFTNLSNDHKDIIASAMITQKFYKNQTIIMQGDPGSTFYYIKEGIASVFKGAKFIRKLLKGDSFGEQSLYYNTMRQLTIKADDEVTCLVLGRDTLNRVLNDKIFDVTFKNFIKWAFQKNLTIAKLSKVHLEKIIEGMKISSFKANQSIFKKGLSGFQKIVVIIEGSLKKLKNGTIVASKGQCFGEEFLLEANKSKSFEDQIVMQTYGVLAEIPDNLFFQAIGGTSYQEVIKKVEKNKEKMVSQFQNNLKKLTLNLRIEDLIHINKINDGQFGGVYLVKDLNKNIYVVKAMKKQLLEQYEVEKFINDQKKIMNTIAFPFIIQAGRSFQTQNHLFTLNEYICGEDFYDVIRKIGLLSTEDCQFYIASIILILEYFNDNLIVCRDIKPQNFMVDSKGYLKLISLSTSKIVKTQNNQMGKTLTIIGTPHYMAPDIILGKGYNNLADLWSLGICLYEFICGVLPFGDAAEGPYDIYEEIMQSQLKFPQFINDKKARKLIQQLLNHNPDHRHAGSFHNLKSHSWFEDFSWGDLIMKNDKKLETPYQPQVSLRVVKDEAMNATQKFINIIKDLDKTSFENLDQRDREFFDWTQFGDLLPVQSFD